MIYRIIYDLKNNKLLNEMLSKNNQNLNKLTLLSQLNNSL